MTPSDDLQRLVERIEAATEGARELDAKIALACDPEFAGWIEHPANHGNQYGEVAPSREAFDEWLIGDGTPCLISTPAYTRSVDAAMTLVPEGAGLSIQRYWIAAVDGPVWSAGISTGGIPSNPRRVFESYDAANAALAITAAALRARITQETHNDPSSNG